MQLNLASAVALLAAVSPALATSTLVPQLQQLTQGVSNTREIFNDLQIVSIFQQGPKGLNTYQQEIIKAKAADIQNPPSQVEEADQAAVCENFVNFATVSQDLMNALIGKHALLSATPFAAPVAALLRTDEGLTDALTYNIKGLVPSCEGQIAEPMEKLSNAYTMALDVYN